MTETFYFYDLETSGFNPKTQRIMQFAGQRVSLDLEPLGEPDDILIRLTPDVLPDPEAVVLTGITPQKTLSEGISERDFIIYFEQNISLPGTIFVGFNTVRFDDEFIRYLMYRNLKDPYEWQWKDGRSKWDILDLVRMTRALRPEGIKWPTSDDGISVNKLELIAALNNIDHVHAHNAYSDVLASIEVAKLIRAKQPKLFNYLLKMRDKNEVKKLVEKQQPLVYTCGRYDSRYEKTAVVLPVFSDATRGSSYVFDLRFDIDKWLSDEAYRNDNPALKELKYNRCPAIAPLSVIDPDGWYRLDLSKEQVNVAADKIIAKNSEIQAYVQAIIHSEKEPFADQTDADSGLYNGFASESDRKEMKYIWSLSPEKLVEYEPQFNDTKYEELYFLYRARQFPKTLLMEDRIRWDKYLAQRLLEGGEQSRYAQYQHRIQKLAQDSELDADRRYILEELVLYGQAVVPLDSYEV